MKRLYSILLFLSFLVCFLQWPPDHASFIFQLEYDLLFHRSDAVQSFYHPLVLLPFLGQILLLITIFLKNPGRRLVLAGMILLSPLVLVIFLVGLLTLNWKITLSALPFVIVAILYIRYYRKIKPALTPSP